VLKPKKLLFLENKRLGIRDNAGLPSTIGAKKGHPDKK
jgi:hypothetical protein